MDKSEKFLKKRLIQRAKDLAAAGFSVIPIYGNGSAREPKKPARRWKGFQSRIASVEEIEGTFDEGVTALGIVCGRVSKLLVIDFDDHLRYQRFCRHLPQYSKTYAVKTRRGYHLYFRTTEKVPSHQFDGGDIKAEKSYVLAPPSLIGDFVYRCVNDVGVQQLEKADLDRILNYFHVNASAHVVRGRLVREGKDVDVTRVYKRLTGEVGRNNALFRAASVAREVGMAKGDAEVELLQIHVEEQGHAGHERESAQDRLQEGLRTIESAYKNDSVYEPEGPGIPNSVRERLLREQRSTVVARLLESFVLAGWRPDAFFCLRDAIRLGATYGLNRKSVMLALTGELCSFDGRHIISRRYAEYLDIEGLNMRKRGRPVELVFEVPSMSRLLSILKVSWTPSDRIECEDVKSAIVYRLAVHREYIRRLSPRVSMKMLADRLGVDQRTVRRYNESLEVKVTACIGRFGLTRESLASLPKRHWGLKKNATNGYWLELAGGMRFPAWRHIGARLLKQAGGPVDVCVRRPSQFSLCPEPVAAVQYEKISAGEFLTVRRLRGEEIAGQGLFDRLRGLRDGLVRRASMVRYGKIQLFFDTVGQRIANDKVAESINGYLYALDDAGAQVRRPAKRGIAFRMLKEFGDGNVFLALRSSYMDVLVSLGRHALQAGNDAKGAELLAQASG